MENSSSCWPDPYGGDGDVPVELVAAVEQAEHPDKWKKPVPVWKEEGRGRLVFPGLF